MLKNFTIYGERCSGTNFLEHAIIENFELEYTIKYTWKHFFGHYNFENNQEEDDTLFIGIIRNPITWIDSLYNKMHHIPEENRHNYRSFMFNTFYSMNEATGKEIMEDRNIFEMRKVKNDYLTNDMKTKVKNYILIRYEDLRDNYDVVLDFIKNKFNLTKKNQNEPYKRIDKYKGNKKELFTKKMVTLPPRIIKIVKDNIDIEQEKKIGYLL